LSKREKKVCLSLSAVIKIRKKKRKLIQERKKYQKKKQKRKNEGKKKYLDVRYFLDTFSIVSVIERTIHEKNKRKSF